MTTVSVASIEQVDPEPPFGQEAYGPSRRGGQNTGTSLESRDERVSVAGASAKKQGARFHIKRLKQHNRSLLAPLYVTFPTREEMCSFSADYKMTFEEHPDVLAGRLDVAVE